MQGGQPVSVAPPTSKTFKQLQQKSKISPIQDWRSTLRFCHVKSHM